MMDYVHRITSLSLIGLLLAACGDGSDPYSFDSDTTTDSETESDANTDSDVETDTTTDFDTGTDTSPPPGCEKVITFPDTVLNQIIRDELGFPTGDIYYEDLLGITSIYISDAG